mgnify:CR=1 FL=1
MRDELSLLEAQLTYKKRLEAMATELKEQRAVLQQKVALLEQKMLLEKQDVERLEGKSLTAFYYHAFGKMNEKLEGERREFYAARVKYDAAVRELKAVELDLEITEEDLQDLQDCEQRFIRAMEEKRSAIEASGTDQSREFLEKEQDLNFLKSQEQELQEAITAGTAALRVANDMVLSLKHVESLGLIDRLGSTFLTDMAKREVLDDAQKNVEQLQVQLQKFNKELADVKLRDNLAVGMGKLLKFTDTYFGNLLTVETPADRVRESIRQVDETRDLILGMLRQLQSRLEEVRYRQAAMQKELEKMILTTEL